MLALNVRICRAVAGYRTSGPERRRPEGRTDLAGRCPVGTTSHLALQAETGTSSDPHGTPRASPSEPSARFHQLRQAPRHAHPVRSSGASVYDMSDRSAWVNSSETSGEKDPAKPSPASDHRQVARLSRRASSGPRTAAQCAPHRGSAARLRRASCARAERVAPVPAGSRGSCRGFRSSP